jgi:4a-hydroxytetrahydrobiopterin dehydratase
MTHTIHPQEMPVRLKSLNDWSVEKVGATDCLTKSFKFKNFAQAFEFMTHVAELAEEQDHHPDWRNVYDRVEIKLTTQNRGGITEKDFTLAQSIDGIKI